MSDGASTTRQSSTLFSNRQPALVSSPTVASGTFGKQKTQTFAKIVVLFGFFSIVRLCYGIGNVDVGYNLASFVFFVKKLTNFYKRRQHQQQRRRRQPRLSSSDDDVI